MKVVVFGGNGFVGSRVAQAALNMGARVVSISRSGAPPSNSKNYMRVMAKAPEGAMTWVSGDVFKPKDYAEHLKGASGVVSCIGAFGSDAFMEKMNGDANCLAISESLRAKVPRFVFVSTVENTLPDFLLKGYFHGKRRAEEALMDAYPQGGVVLRPSFVYGCREVTPAVEVPLGLLGQPLKTILSIPGVSGLQQLPGMKAILTPPVSVEDVGTVAAAAALPVEVVNPGSDHPCEGIISADAISSIGKQFSTNATMDFIRDQVGCWAESEEKELVEGQAQEGPNAGATAEKNEA